MVDLSKAKAGDTVKFRCGGEAVIAGFKRTGNDHFLWFKPTYGTHFDSMDYRLNGICKTDCSLFDIVELVTTIIPANVSSMTYKTKERMIEALDWIEKHWDLTSEAEMFQAIKEAKIHLTRAPEHDVEVG